MNLEDDRPSVRSSRMSDFSDLQLADEKEAEELRRTAIQDSFDERFRELIQKCPGWLEKVEKAVKHSRSH